MILYESPFDVVDTPEDEAAALEALDEAYGRIVSGWDPAVLESSVADSQALAASSAQIPSTTN